MEVWWNNYFLMVKIWNHPLEKTILWMFQVPEDPIISNSSDTVLIILNLSFGWKKTTNSRWSSEKHQNQTGLPVGRGGCTTHLKKGTRLSSKCPVENTIKKCHKPPTRVIHHIHLTLCTCSRKNVPAPYPQPLVPNFVPSPSVASAPCPCVPCRSENVSSVGGDEFLVAVLGLPRNRSKYPVCLAY